MLPIAGQTAGPNGLIFLWKLTGSRGEGVSEAKKNLKKLQFFFYGQRRVLQLVTYNYVLFLTTSNKKMLNIFSVLYLSLYKNQKVTFLNEAYSVYSFKSIFSFSKYYRRFIYIGNSCFCQKTKIPLLGLSPRFKKFWKIRLGS